jgi:UDP-N-acetyl-D-glucosamine dehydrogenase
MAKLMENTFRQINVAFANEMALICERLGVDVWEVIDAAATKPFGFMPFYPGPGLGGPCIPVVPHYLAWKLKTLGYDARFIALAEEINGAMPAHVVNLVADALDEGKTLRGSRVLVLGITYKPDVADTRESPPLAVLEGLLAGGADAVYHDPFVPEVAVNGQSLASIALDDAALREADCVVVATNHTSYDWDEIVEHARLIVDTRNATARVPTEQRARGARIVKLGAPSIDWERGN